MTFTRPPFNQFPSNEGIDQHRPLHVSEFRKFLDEIEKFSLDFTSLSLSGDLVVNGTTTLNGITNLNGTINLGDAAADSLSISATTTYNEAINYSNATGITAYSGGGQASATQLTEEINNVTTVSADNDSVKLPTAVAGKHVRIKNNGLSILAVFPATGDSIDKESVDASILIAPGTVVDAYCKDTTVWETSRMSVTLNAYSMATGVTAFAGGGQLNATTLIAENNYITTVNTVGDSIKLPKTVKGVRITVKNGSTNSLDCFPGIDDSINSLTKNTAIKIPGKSAKVFFATDSEGVFVWKEIFDVMAVNDGSVGSPSLTFNSSPNDGFYNIGSHQFAATVNGSMVAMFDSNGIQANSVKNRVTLGTAGINCTVIEYGDGRDITAVVTLANISLGTPTAGTNQALGALAYSFPSGVHAHMVTYMSVGLTIGGVTTDTPDVGVGSVIASGVVSVLGGTAAFEDYITGQTAADTSGTATSKTSVATAGALTGISINESGMAKNVYINAAAAWNAGITGNLVANGTIVLKWTKLA